MSKSVRPIAVFALSCLIPAIVPLVAFARADPGPAGRVLFAVGDAQRVSAAGQREPLRVGSSVFAGDSIVTADGASVQVRMVDQALVAVRPNSRLSIPVYEFDSRNPAASRIKLELVSGNSRTVSGKGGEAAKQNYRFNTPLAAIGLRGTDYTVSAAADATRVSVASGAVVVSPIGDGCSAAQFGPCQSALSRELTAAQQHAYLEVSAKSRVPSIVLPEQDPSGAARQNPAERAGEPSASRGGGGTRGSSSDTSVSASGAQSPDRSKETARNDITKAAVVDDLVVSVNKLQWGRWNAVVDGSAAPTVTSLLGPGREITVGNDVFGLVRAAAPLNLPVNGVVSFTMAGSEAVVQSAAGLEAAKVIAGSMSIDFFKRGFDTAIAVKHGGGQETLTAAGAVTYLGFLYSNPNKSNMTVNGAIAQGGTEAAYLFEKSLLANKTLLGAVRWLR
jgi:hypothetical protein